MWRQHPAWALFKWTDTGRGGLNFLSEEASGRYASLEACEADRERRFALWQRMWSQGRPGELGITWLEAPQHGYIQRLGPQLQRRELFLCVVAVNTDT
jgi:hypothetical protein